MSIEENRAALARAVENFNRAGDKSGYFELYDQRIALHDLTAGATYDFDALKRNYIGMWEAFPDFHLAIDEVIGEGETLACRYTGRGTRQRDQQQVTFVGMSIMHFQNGRCVERWDIDKLQRKT